MNNKPVVYANPPAACQLCNGPLNGTFYDARLPWGQWGNICRKCFNESGCSLGTGRGQQYSLIYGLWQKAAG